MRARSMADLKKFQVGDRVKNSDFYLKSINAKPGSFEFTRKGTVTEYSNRGFYNLVRVRWDGTNFSERFSSKELDLEQPKDI